MDKTLAPEAAARLNNFLMAKGILEALFVGALAIVFYLTAFNPFFRGAVDLADAQHVAGWVVNRNDPARAVEVQLYVDGQFAGSTAANLSRPDVLAAGRAADERHGFIFETPQLSPGEHEARVYAVHASGAGERRTLQQVGQPVVFSVAQGEAKD
jgi:hypothetical protein